MNRGYNYLNAYQVEIIDWAKERGIIDNSDPYAQMMKTIEELGELSSGLQKDSIDDIEDAIGDVLVTLMIISHMKGTTVENGIKRAHETIMRRKGRMVGGVFVKDDEAA